MKRFFFPTLLIWIALSLYPLQSCKKVDRLNDISTLDSFEILTVNPNVTINKSVIDGNTITIYLPNTKNIFPLMVSAKATSHDAVKILGDITEPMVFRTDLDTKRFYLISESGVPTQFLIKLLFGNRDADIKKFSTLEGYTAEIDPTIAEVFINVGSANTPITIHPIIELSEGASSNISQSIVFNTMYEEKDVIVTSKEKLYIRTWRIKLNTQIPNSDFEMWIEEGKDKRYFNIDPYPGKGKGWCTANNSFVQGVFPVSHNGGKAAEVKTATQTVLGNELITAGSIFTGYFEMGFNFSDPKSMTFFGIPCRFNPKSVNLTAKYTPGPTLKRSLKNSVGTYKIQDIPGEDEGHIWIEILNWSGKGDPIYHGKSIEGLTVIGKGDIVLKRSDFQDISIPINYTETKLNATHIVVVMSSSIKGDLFQGAPGSSMIVDKVRLIY